LICASASNASTAEDTSAVEDVQVALVLACIAQQVVSEWESCGHLYMISEATGRSFLILG